MINPIDKPQKIVSKKIRRFAKGKPCTLRIPYVCESTSENTCACHVNSNYKGTSNKSPDIFTFIACNMCHYWADEGYVSQGVSKAERDQEILRAMMETQYLYVTEGLISIN